jgi:proteasome assembly chaperone (PAC2) family protein
MAGSNLLSAVKAGMAEREGKLEQVRLTEKPKLNNPVMIAAFAGWNDAAQSATSVARFLLRRWSARRFGEVDPDDFFDFTETRPTVRIVDGSLRRVEWPGTELFYHRDDAQGHDYVLLLGIEPQLRWKVFVESILGVCQQLGVGTLVSIGALLADVPHTVPTKVIGLANDPDLVARLRRLDAQPSQYEGPTGIVGVINAMAGERGMKTASIWGSVPMYLSAIPNPKVTLGILQRLDGLLDMNVYLGELEEMSRQFDQQVANVMANNPQIANYVQQLEEKERAAAAGMEESHPEPEPPPSGTPDLPSGKGLVEDIEEFLRRLQRDGGNQEP